MSDPWFARDKLEHFSLSLLAQVALVRLWIDRPPSPPPQLLPTSHTTSSSSSSSTSSSSLSPFNKQVIVACVVITCGYLKENADLYSWPWYGNFSYRDLTADILGTGMGYISYRERFNRMRYEVRDEDFFHGE